MYDMKVMRLKTLLAVATVTFCLSGCMRANPVTGQQEMDVGATAGIAGAAMGAAALGVALSNNNNNWGGPGWGGGGRVTTVNNVNVNNSRNARVNRNSNLNRNPNVNRIPNRGMNQRPIARGGNRNVGRVGHQARARRR